MTELEKQYRMVMEAAKELRLRWALQIVNSDFRDDALQSGISAKAAAFADLLIEMSDMLVNEQQQALD